MKTVLVTGGAGFIGSTFVRQRIAAGDARIVNLDLLTYAGNLESLDDVRHHPRHLFVHGDIRDDVQLEYLFREHRPDAVVHFAAESHVDRSIGAPAEFILTNVVGTQRLLEAARRHWSDGDETVKATFRFLHVSTDEVYGSLGPTGKFTESSPYAPNSPYSASKAAADHLARAYYRTYGLPVIISNSSNNYGPYQFPEKLIPLMILKALEGENLPVYGDGQHVRDWLHVDDHCQALNLLLLRGRPGRVYNIGGGEERTNWEVVTTICDMVDQLCPQLPHRPCRQLITFVEDRPGHDRRYGIDCSRIRTELGWKPARTLDDGIRQTVQWYIENREWCRRVTAGKYQRQRLGLGTSRGEPAPATVPAPHYDDGLIQGVLVKRLDRKADARGWLIELVRQDELPYRFHPAMAYVSATEPGVVRGPHEHIEQADYFCFIGPGTLELVLWDSRPSSPSYGKRMRIEGGESDPVAVLVPPGVVHLYRSISDSVAWVINAPNRLYAGAGRKQPVDEIRHENTTGHPYTL